MILLPFFLFSLVIGFTFLLVIWVSVVYFIADDPMWCSHVWYFVLQFKLYFCHIRFKVQTSGSGSTLCQNLNQEPQVQIQVHKLDCSQSSCGHEDKTPQLLFLLDIYFNPAHTVLCLYKPADHLYAMATSTAASCRPPAYVTDWEGVKVVP